MLKFLYDKTTIRSNILQSYYCSCDTLIASMNHKINLECCNIAMFNITRYMYRCIIDIYSKYFFLSRIDQ